MKYFLDTEFIEGFHKPWFGKRRHFIDLISIGIIDEDGRSYYAISSEFEPEKADTWVTENVLLPLYEEIVKKDFDRWKFAMPAYTGLPDKFSISNLKKAIKRFGKSNKQISEDILEFCTGDNIGIQKAKYYGLDYSNQNIEFYAYYADYDWVVFCSLFGRMIDLPNGFPMYCRDLKQLLDEIHIPDHLSWDKSKQGHDLIKTHPNYPKQDNEHNALADAKWNKELHNFLQQLKPSGV